LWFEDGVPDGFWAGVHFVGKLLGPGWQLAAALKFQGPREGARGGGRSMRFAPS
jgi:hypothetical protein